MIHQIHLVKKLGNFNPEKPDPSDTTRKIPGNNKEPDYHYPEDIVIHPPTGVSGDMIKYSIIGVVALAILAGGIVIIKKKSFIIYRGEREIFLLFNLF